MCGIVGFIGKEFEGRITNPMLQGIMNRGEVTESFSGKGLEAYVRRLKIVDREHAVQPLFNSDRTKCIIYNGEIFNFKELKKKIADKYQFSTDSDTETMLYLWEEYGPEALEMVHGQFAFVIYNLQDGSFVAARDRLGINPLYFSQSDDGFYFGSTVASLVPSCKKIEAFEPGNYYESKSGFHNYFTPVENVKKLTEAEAVARVQSSLIESVKMRVDTDLPVGVIYSGGVDSTIVLDQAVRYHNNVTAFTIGREGSEDFEISKRFCKERNIKQVIIPVKHRDLNFSAAKNGVKISELTEYLDIINAVITLPLFREINRHGIKVVLSGDGSDELFGGYDMYDKISRETAAKLFQYKLEILHRTELQRVDRSAGAWKVENRVPFLDKTVVETALMLEQCHKIKDGVEKWCVRKAFEDFLPEYILYRKKNPLSHSSGLHEKVRIKKILFKKYYNSFKFDRHDKMRRDFSITLQSNNYNIEKSVTEQEIYIDYSLKHKLLETVKGFIRFYFTAPARKAEKRCISGNL